MKTSKINLANPIVKLISGILLIILAALLLILDIETWKIIAVLTATAILISAAISKFIVKATNRNYFDAVFTLIFYALLATAVIVFAKLFVGSIFLILGILALAIAVLRILICIHLATVDGPGLFSNAFSAIICIIFGVLMLSDIGSQNTFILQLVCGLYCVFYAITCFGDFFAQISKADMKSDKSKRRTHFALPNFVTALFTTKIIKYYDALLEEDDTLTEIVEEKETDTPMDINFHILVHVSHNILSRMGHVDISIGDTVYSYGNYDSSKNLFGGFISGGAFIIVPKAPYLVHCLTAQRKFVIDYGCSLSDEQMAKVKAKIEDILKSTTELDMDNPDIIDLEHNEGAKPVHDMNGKLYRVDKGPFKRYFAISSNCVQLADNIIGETGFDALSKNSIRTPGAYYDMMDKQFKRKNTRVLTKTAYLQTEAGAKRKADKKLKEEKEAAKKEKEKIKNKK